MYKDMFKRTASLLLVLASLMIVTALVSAGANAASKLAPLAFLLLMIAGTMLAFRKPMNQRGDIVVDIFDTRTMLASIEQDYEPRAFLVNTFFSGTETSETLNVDIDLYKGKRRLAPFVQPFAQAKVIDRIGWTTRSFKPAYIKEKIPTTAAQILKRQMGDTIYQGGLSPAEKAAVQLGKDQKTLIDMILRREEWMAAQILQSGKVRCQGDDIDVTIDFLLASDHVITLTLTAKWSDTTNSTPITNLRTWRRKVSQDSGIVPRIAVFGQDVMDNFLANTKQVLAQGALASVKIDRGQIVPEELEDGVIYWGYLKDPGLDVYTYDEWYIDPADGVEKPMVPGNAVILGSPSARTARHYGAIQNLKAMNGLAQAQYFPTSWEENDPSVRWLMIESAPVPAMHQPDAFLVAFVQDAS